MNHFLRALGFIFSLVFCSQVFGQSYSYSFEAQVHFISGQAELSDEALYEYSSLVRYQQQDFRQQLDAMGILGTDIVVKQVVIKSRTDAKGSETTNMAISEKRAQGLVSVVGQVFNEQNISFNPDVITAIGLGESESNEGDCKYVQIICGMDKGENLKEGPKTEDKNWAIAAYDFLADLILPSSHARERKTFLELLFGTRRRERAPAPQYYDPQAPQYYNDQNGSDSQQCEQEVWDEACLDAQRITSIEIVFENRPKPVDIIITTPLDTPETPEAPPAATPAAPIPQLNLYGNPL